MLHIRDLVRDPFSPRSPLLSLSSEASLFLPKYPRTRKTGSLRAWRKTSEGATYLLSALLSEHRPLKECNQSAMHGVLLPLIHMPKDLHGHFIGQHLRPGPCALTTALPVPLPRESLRAFLFISTPFLPGQRTTLTSKQAPRQVLQGTEECHLIRGKDEK